MNFLGNIFGNSKLRFNPRESGLGESDLLRQELDKKQSEIQQLKRIIEADDGSWEMVGVERKYSNDDDQSRFDRKKHRNLIGLSMENFRSEGLESERTLDNSPLGDLCYSNTGSREDKAKLKKAMRKMQLKYNPIEGEE